MARLQTPRAKITGLGSAGHGSHHFLVQRVTALILLVLVPFVLFGFVASFSSGFEAVRIWVGSLLGTSTLLVLVTAIFWHLRLGIQVIVEDYFGGTLRPALLLISMLGCLALWLVSVLSILKIFFEG